MAMAMAIIQMSDQTDLVPQYENKRFQVNAQLKFVFNAGGNTALFGIKTPHPVLKPPFQVSSASNSPLDSNTSNTSQTHNSNTSPQAYTSLQSTERKTQDALNSCRKQILLGTLIMEVLPKATVISMKIGHSHYKKNAQISGLNTTVSATATINRINNF